MCITQVTSFRVGDKLYDTEIDAVEAALKNIAAKLLREHPDNLYAGLLKHGEEIGLLIDKKRLLSRTAPATVEGSPEAVPPSVPPSGGTHSGVVVIGPGPLSPREAAARQRAELDHALSVSPHSSDRLGG